MLSLQKVAAFAALLFFMATGAEAQQAAYTVFYRQNWQLVNPAAFDRWNYFASRLNSTMMISGGFRQQWLGGGLGKDAPHTWFISAERTPAVNKNHSSRGGYNPIRLGITGVNDRTGAFGTAGLYGNFCYYFDAFEDDYVYLGISAGLVDFRLRGELTALDAGDVVVEEALDGKLNKQYADFSLGIFYRKKKWFYTGLSMPQVFTVAKANKGFGVEKVAPLYFVMGSFIEFGEHDPQQEGDRLMNVVEPSLWVRYATGLEYYSILPKTPTPLSLDFDLRWCYREKFWLSAGYGSNQMARAEFGVIKAFDRENRMRIGFGYGYPIGRRYLNMGQSFDVTFSYGAKN